MKEDSKVKPVNALDYMLLTKKQRELRSPKTATPVALVLLERLVKKPLTRLTPNVLRTKPYPL